LNRQTGSIVRFIAASRARRGGQFGQGSFETRCLLLSLILGSVAAHNSALAQIPEADAPAIEAAMLRNFARYVTWPPTAFHNTESPWQLCILGADPFGTVLDRSVAGRVEQGRSFSITRAVEPEALKSCQIVFIAAMDVAKRRAALSSWKSLPMLTVSDAPGFLQEGGTIRLDVNDRVDVSVNLDQARSLGLKIQTKLLEVAHEVLDNGALRRRR
jgi:hypothetical protein